MATNRSDERGFVTEGPIDGTVTTILSGNVQIPNYGSIPKWEYYSCSGSQTFSGSNNYSVLQFNGALSFQQNGLSLWNTASNVFQPTVVGRWYTIRLTAKISGTYFGSTPALHTDFDVKGYITTGSGGGHVSTSMNLQATSYDAALGTSHTDILTNYHVVADAAMVASGAQFYATAANQSIVSFFSASLLIKEG